MRAGRPTAHTPEIAEAILLNLAEGRSLRAICKAEDMPPESTVRGWAIDDTAGFSAQYTKAREIGYHAMADELLEIADDAANDWMEREGDGGAGYALNGDHIQRSRLRTDTRKWLMSKALPKIYGDKLALGGDKDMDPIRTEETGKGAAKLAALLDAIDSRTPSAPE